MINKLYEKSKKIIKENVKFMIFFVVILLLFFVELPYYIDTSGGILNLKDRVKIENKYESKGSFNLTYVSELKGNLIFVLFSFINPNWDLIKKSDVISSNETVKESNFRNKMLLNEANDYAIISAFDYALKEYEINNRDLYVTYIDENSDTDLKIGDKIIKVDGNVFNDKTSLKEYILNKNLNDEIIFKVENDNVEYDRKAKIVSINKKKAVGILITEDLEISTNPKIDFKFKTSESGPSAGLMTTLEIYNSITKEDITKGKTIAGTGTIDEKGNVGSIGGVEYKLKAAEKDNADIFFVPKGDNLKEAKKIKNEKKYDIEIVGISSLNEAINFLKKY
ncbi:MAG: PDZ domain-containing protein [Bacilli bacterium]|nr:PDZ domain-containing protein [Bacilli bacterium]